MKYSPCPFCNPEKNEIVIKNKFWYAKWDKYPVNKGHILIITFRHEPSYFNATKEETRSLLNIIERCKLIIDFKFQPDGYNIGINIGVAAGQTIMHLHVHLIPRYKGDIEKPEGGVRGVIPRKRIYPM